MPEQTGRSVIRIEGINAIVLRRGEYDVVRSLIRDLHV